MLLSKSDIERVNQYLEENPEVQFFNLVRDDSSGIGYTLSLEYETMQKLKTSIYQTTVRVELVGVEEW